MPGLLSPLAVAASQGGSSHPSGDRQATTGSKKQAGHFFSAKSYEDTPTLNIPPSTGNATPLMLAPCWELKKVTARPMSSGVPYLRVGMTLWFFSGRFRARVRGTQTRDSCPYNQVGLRYI